MIEDLLETHLGYRVRGEHIEFANRDRLRVNELGSARSGARPASPQEIEMWGLLVQFVGEYPEKLGACRG